MEDKHQIIITEDGSSTLIHPLLDESYHSIHGAIQESNHIFIDAGLKYWLNKSTQNKTISILEIGFGTGLNILLTIQVLRQEKRKFQIHSIEKFPIGKEISDQLNYGKILNQQQLFEQIHSLDWNQRETLSTNEAFIKEKVDLTNFECNTKYDVVYFDAFSPEKQQELWTGEIFRKLYACMNMGAVLTTYSAKGQVRRNMQSAGFTVERISGPPGKREMLRAIKPIKNL